MLVYWSSLLTAVVVLDHSFNMEELVAQFATLVLLVLIIRHLSGKRMRGRESFALASKKNSICYYESVLFWFDKLTEDCDSPVLSLSDDYIPLLQPVTPDYKSQSYGIELLKRSYCDLMCPQNVSVKFQFKEFHNTGGR